MRKRFAATGAGGSRASAQRPGTLAQQPEARVQHRGLSLRWRMILILAGLPLLLLVPAFLYVGGLYYNSYREAYWSKAALAVQQVDKRIGDVRPFYRAIYDAPSLPQVVRDVAGSSEDFDFVAIVDEEGRVVLHSTWGYQGVLVEGYGDLSGGATAYGSGTGSYNVVLRDLDRGRTYIVWRPVSEAGEEEISAFILVGEPAALVNPPIVPLVVGAVAAAVLLVLLIRFSLYRLAIKPLEDLAEGAAIVGAGDLAHTIVTGRADEFGFVAEAFNQMSGELNALVSRLEQNVAERTAALQRRNAQLEAISIVGQAAARERNVARVLETAANEITAHFNFYHTGIFIVNDTQEWAILRAASSEGGRRMLARGHRLRVGAMPQDGGGQRVPGAETGSPSGTGIVGYVAATGKSRIAVNVGEDVVWFNNADLPLTRSELALPLATETEVVGVLDVQSEDVAAFSEDDISTLQLMADQLTIALANARALEGMQSALAELRELQVDYGRRGWARVTQRMRPLAYEYDRVETMPVAPLAVPQDLAAGQVAHAVVMDGETPVVMEALRVGDQVLGYLGLSDSQRIWSEEELSLVRSVGEQVAMALDNARLFEDTQRNERQQVLISRVLQAASDPELSTTAVLHEIGCILAAGLDMAVLILTLPFSDLSQWDDEPGLDDMGTLMATESKSAPILARAFVDPNGHDLMIGEQEVPLAQEQLRFFRGLAEPSTGPAILGPAVVGTPTLGGELTMGGDASLAGQDLDQERVLYVPIARAGAGTVRAEGFIGLYRWVGAPPLDAETRDLTRSLASQMAVVLENLNLSEETHRRSEELRDLYRISLVLSELLEPLEVLGGIVRHGGQLLGADAANLWVYDSETEMLSLTYEYEGGAEGRLESGQGEVRLHARADQWEGIAGQALVEERTIVVSDYVTWEHRRPNLVSSRFRAMMAVPLIGRFGSLGVLVALSERVGFFGSREAGLADLFSAQATAALENARLNQEARQRADEFQQLYEAGTELITILDSEMLLARAAEWARRVFNAQRAVVFLHDSATGRYVRGQSVSEGRYLPDTGSEQPSPGGLTEYIIRTRKPLLIRNNAQLSEGIRLGPSKEQGPTDPQTPQSSSSLERLTEVGLLTQMGAPLRIGDEVLGALFVNGAAVDQFGDRDLSLLEFLAAQVSSALQNAIQFGQTERALAVVGQQARYQTNISQAVALLNERGIMATSEFLRLLGEASEVPAALYFRSVSASGNGAGSWQVSASWFAEGEKHAGLKEAMLGQLSTSPAIFFWARILRAQGSMMLSCTDMPFREQKLLADHGLSAVLALSVPEESSTAGFVILLRDGFVGRDFADEGFMEEAGTDQTPASEAKSPLWSDQEVVALQTAAAALSNTLARERLFGQVQATLNETEALYRGSAALSEASTFEGILDVLLAHTLLGEGFSTATLQLLDRTWGGEMLPAMRPSYAEIVAAQSHKYPADAITLGSRTRIELHKFSTSLNVLSSGTPVFIEDIRSDTVLDRRTRALLGRAMGANSVVIVPLVVGGQRIGYLHADYAAVQHFPEAARRRLVNLSQQAAIAVLNIRQLRATQARVQREQLIREITGHIQEATDVQGVLQTAVRELGRAFGTSRNRIQFRPHDQRTGLDPEE
jgi:GAF domain-containing protein